MKRVAFLMSETGGGHRAAGKALEAALSIRYPETFETQYVDVYRNYAPWPWKHSSYIYPRWVKYSVRSHSMYYLFTDYLMRRSITRNTLLGGFGKNGIKDLVDTYRPDLAVVLHGAFTRFAVASRNKIGLDLRIMTVITDMAKPHFAWYHPGVDRCVVPCQGAYDRGLEAGLPADKLRLLGHPAHPKFVQYKASEAEARRELGWSLDKPVIMTVGGGEGMGALADIAQAINAKALDAQLVIICGKNEKLKAKLDAVSWNQTTHVYGFANNIEVMMRAADILITKAGPGTIAEAAISGLPMILSGAIPYQESPNIGFVVENGAGVHATEPEAMADALQDLLRPGNDQLTQMAAATEAIAYPNAAFDIAAEIAAQCGVLSPA